MSVPINLHSRLYSMNLVPHPKVFNEMIFTWLLILSLQNFLLYFNLILTLYCQPMHEWRVLLITSDNVVFLGIVEKLKKSNYVSLSCNLQSIFSFFSVQLFRFLYLMEWEVSKISQKVRMKVLVFVYKLNYCDFESRCSYLRRRCQKERYSYFFGLWCCY